MNNIQKRSLHWRITAIVIMPLLALILAACGGATAEQTANPSPVASPALAMPTETPASAQSGAMSMAPEPLPEGLELLQRLVLDKPIVVGVANESAQTAILTIPTMF